MKKEMLIFVGLVVVVLLGSSVFAADVAYVLKNERNVEEGYLEVFEELGLSVDLIESRSISETDFSEYNLILISDGRLKNVKSIPINEIPTVIANRQHLRTLGLISGWRISRLFSSTKLKVKKNGGVVNIYEKTFTPFKSRGISCAYLPRNYKSDEWMSIATTYTRRNNELGDVIAYSDDEVRKCFFGITKTDSWTSDAKGLFKDCVDFVSSGLKFHDVKIDNEYANSVDGVRIKDVEGSVYLLDDVAQLSCDKDYKVDFKTFNVGSYVEDIDFSGKIENGWVVFDWDARKTGLGVGKSTTTGSKTFTADFDEGFYDIVINAVIRGDANPSDNSMSRSVEIVC